MIDVKPAANTKTHKKVQDKLKHRDKKKQSLN